VSKLKRLLLFLSISISTSFFQFISNPTPVSAQQEFDTRFNSTYQISNQGITTVTHEVELTNKLSNVYAQQYTITSGSTRIKQIEAHSNTGPITTKKVTQNNQTEINLFFEKPVTGKNQTQRFTISYINLDIATKNGRVLEVNIPRLANLNNLNHYNLSIKVPKNFDSPTYIYPPTQNISQDQLHQIIKFNKNQISSKGISLLFGNHQTFDFTLRYSLHNPGVTNATAQIAIPPDTAFQQVFYHNIDPSPINIIVDPDNNWLASYKLKPKQTLIITLTGQSILYLKPTIQVPSTPDTTLKSLLDQQTFWQTQDPKIIQLAQQLKTAENIYSFLVENLTYNYDRVDTLSTTRLGGLQAINNPQNAICTEFTDAFVAIARAAGIPARAHDGYAFTPNSRLRPLSLKLDVLHAWPEYYDQTLKKWIQIDPTWGNTTQGIDYFSRWDLNHFTFAIHGLDSIKPYPAGSYKLETTSGKDVNISFSHTEPKKINKFDVKFTSSQIKLPLFPQTINANLVNRGNTAIHLPKIKAESKQYNILDITDKINTLPPFASTQIQIKVKPKSVFKSTNKLTLFINDQSFTYQPQKNQTAVAFAGNYIKIIAMATIGLGVTTLIWRLLVPKFRKKHPLHR